MAVALKPRLLLMDEPTSGVAASEKMDIVETLVRVLRDAGVTAVFVEHDMDVVERFADRVAVWSQGRIAALGPPDEVLTDPAVQRDVIGIEARQVAMLRLEGVCVDIAGVPVLRYVSLTVPPGGRVALIGRNGAGKTTTLRALMGLAPCATERSRSTARDETACRRTTARAHGIGYAPEERRLFGSFTVRDNMLLPAQVLRLSNR